MSGSLACGFGDSIGFCGSAGCFSLDRESASLFVGEFSVSADSTKMSSLTVSSVSPKNSMSN